MNIPYKRLKAVVESDPGSLVRLLHYFQARNVVPLRVLARRVDAHYCHVEIDVAESDVSIEAMRIIAAKIGELTVSVCSALCDEGQ